ncbi:MAG: hypothetical protein U0805_15650 [Pirellulales bacterium]
MPAPIFWTKITDPPHLFWEIELAMFADQIEKMKRDYTDKFVVVDANRPELARFRDVVGRVKTVNMSGRALVEFADYHLNVGWYDIDPEFLKVVDQPPPKAPKAEAKKAAAKAPAGEPARGEAASAAGKPKPAAPAKTGKLSVAEMLAAAKSGGAAKAGATPAKPAAAKPTPGEVAAANGPLIAKPDRSKMSVAEMLAAARAGGKPGATPAAPPAKAAPPAAAEQAELEHSPAPETPQALKEAAPTPPPAAKAQAAAAKSTERIDKSKMSIDDMLAWCRQHDTK